MAESKTDETKTWLLLVGINFYPEEANRLRGAVNDVDDIEGSFKEYYKDFKVDVTKLVASVTGDPGQVFPPEPEHLWPTWGNITAALKHITHESSPNDIVYIHYSGHGTLRPTIPSGFTYQDDTGTDAALVLYEPNAQRQVRYLRGIELALLLDDMVNKGLKLTVVLDSCHSGSISRVENPLVRSMRWNDDIDSEFPLQVPKSIVSLASKKVYRDGDTASPWLLHPRGYTLLTACGPHELAKEIDLGSKGYNGALSYHILEALNYYARNQTQNVTNEQIHQRICAKMYSKVAGQNPVLISAGDTTFLGAKVASPEARSTCKVIKVSEDQEIWLNAGLIHGVCIDDKYDVRSHVGTTAPGVRIAITDIHAVNSVAKLDPSLTLKETCPKLNSGDCAVLAEFARPRAYVKLLPGADSAWEEMFEKSISLKRLAAEEPAPIDIPCFSVVNTDSQQYTILDSRNSPIPHLPPVTPSSPSAIYRMRTILEHLSNYTFVQALDNRCADGLLDSDFRICARPQDQHLNVLGSDNSVTVPDGSKVDITFQNLMREELHFVVLDLTMLRRIKHLYPPCREYRTVMPSNAHDVPPTGVVKLSPRMTVPTRLRTQQGSRVSTEDVLKFIVSTKPVLRTKAMQLPDLWDAVEQGAAAAGSADGASEMQVQKNLPGESKETGQLRGATRMERWACRSITIRTVIETA